MICIITNTGAIHRNMDVSYCGGYSIMLVVLAVDWGTWTVVALEGIMMVLLETTASCIHNN